MELYFPQKSPCKNLKADRQTISKSSEDHNVYSEQICNDKAEGQQK